MKKEPTYTPEQIAMLEKNPYTFKVTQRGLSFTLEFKQFFIEQLYEHGLTSVQILAKAGYDVDMLDRSLFYSVKGSIVREYHSEKGLRSPRGLSISERRAIEEKKAAMKTTENAAINELQDRVLHLEAQIDFLKKISSIRNTGKGHV